MAIRDKQDKAALGAAPEGTERVRSTLLRYFTSNSTRSQLPQETLDRLDEIRNKGNELLATLKPFNHASVFLLVFNEVMSDDEARKENPKVAEFHAGAIPVVRRALDAANEFMKGKFDKFPSYYADLETTCALSGFIFLGGAARYCPDVILESVEDPEKKKALAERFIAFYDKYMEPLMEDGKKWPNARTFHESSYKSFLALKSQHPDIFQMFCDRISTSKGCLMAPFGKDKFSTSWVDMHYRNVL